MNTEFSTTQLEKIYSGVYPRNTTSVFLHSVVHDVLSNVVDAIHKLSSYRQQRAFLTRLVTCSIKRVSEDTEELVCNVVSVIVTDVDSQKSEKGRGFNLTKYLTTRLQSIKLHPNKKRRAVAAITKKSRKKAKVDEEDFEDYFGSLDSVDEQDVFESYIKSLSNKERVTLKSTMDKLQQYRKHEKPLKVRLLESGMSLHNKAVVMKKIEQLDQHSNQDGEWVKTSNWVEKLLQIPFGKYHKNPINLKQRKNIRPFLDSVQQNMDKAIYGHAEAKAAILNIVAQEVNNPGCAGNSLALYGPMGNGKTTLIKEGIARAMNRPFAFISLGGATDASFLEGHSFTYEGSVCGKIAEVLIQSKAMNPIIYFDELDKVSKSDKGEEITNLLIHLTDPSQNEHFRDRYFSEVDLDLSKVTFIFSYNAPEKVNPILLDRIHSIETRSLRIKEKLTIVQDYMLPAICKEVGVGLADIRLERDVVDHIITHYTCEGGVRGLKKLLYCIVRTINLRHLRKLKYCDRFVRYPVCITIPSLKKDLFRTRCEVTPTMIRRSNEVGSVNGLYASAGGVGGITIIETKRIRGEKHLDLKLTGMQGKVMQESMHVALSVAYSLVGAATKKLLQRKRKTDGDLGVHCHCPEGSTPKDGPSAGLAITAAIYSLLTNREIRNDVAMTGEINLKGEAMIIGGLEEKLHGAKRAGVKIVLCPRSNQHDLRLIIQNDPDLVDRNFTVVLVDSIHDVLRHAFLSQAAAPRSLQSR